MTLSIRLVHSPALLLVVSLLQFSLTLSSPGEDQPLPVATLNRDTPVDFNAEIVPFLRKNCLACHNRTKAKAGLILETPAAMLKGGDSGPAVDPGNAEASFLFTSAAHLEDPPMPPAKNKSKAVNLTSEELALLKLWIEQGAKGATESAPPAPKKWRRSDHEPIYTVALSSDGRFAACGRGHRVYIYDLLQEKLVAELVDPTLEKAAHRDFVHSLAFGPDGTLASGGYREIKVWRRPEVAEVSGESPRGDHTAVTANLEEKWRTLGQDGASIPPILRVFQSGEVEHLLGAGPDGTMKIWNLANKNLVRSLSVGSAVVALEISADGSKVVVQRSGAGPARLFNLADGKLIKDLELDPTVPVRLAALQLDEQMNARVAAAYKTEVPKAEDVLTKERAAGEKLQKELPKAKETATAKQAEFDKKRAAMEKADEALKKLAEDDPKLAEAKRAAEKAQTEFANAEVELTAAKRDLAAHESNLTRSSSQVGELARLVEETKSKQAAFEAKVATLKTDRESLQKQLTDEVSKLKIAGVTFTPDGSQVVTALEDGTVRFFNAADGTYLETIATRPGISSLSMTENGQLLTRHGDGASAVWETRRSWSLSGTIGDGENPAVFGGRVTALAFGPDGTVLASGSGVPSRSGELKIWNAKSLENIAQNVDAHSDTISDLEFSPDEKHIVTGSPDKFVKTFEVASAKETGSFESHTSNVLGVAWSHDGRRLASASADREVQIWDAETGEQVRTLKGWEEEITSVTFYSKSNEQVLTTCGDRKLRLEQNVFATTEDFQYAAAVSPDGKFIVCGGADGTLRVWNSSRKLVMTFLSPHAESTKDVAASGNR